MKIEHNFASVAHPQANGQVECINKQIVEGIKARLGMARRGWVDELPSILWAHRTMPKTSTGETPFILVYGSEAVIPAEIGLPSPHMIATEKQNNEKERRMDLDLLEERQENAAIMEARIYPIMEELKTFEGVKISEEEKSVTEDGDKAMISESSYLFIVGFAVNVPYSFSGTTEAVD
ncbi:uncharacterized protein LOC110875583 [Helianthus annuus]|uniref:uncharacterized protein LOC110875583 n=1 Tax=Helianthus annuus TaxID=4232 RepID=UPI000B9018CF|nr:uncharacterized protein LOC110875583 [Helianthus annuus]